MNTRKRKSDCNVTMDRIGRALTADFTQAAKNLSHLQNLSLKMQQQAFRAGEVQGLEKLYSWIQSAQGQMPFTVQDVIAYIQAELNYDAKMLAYENEAQLPYEPADIPIPCEDELMNHAPAEADARALEYVPALPPRSFDAGEYFPESSSHWP